MALFDNFAARMQYLQSGTTEKIKKDIRSDFQNPSYAVVTAIEPDGFTEQRQLNTTKFRATKEQLFLTYPDELWISGTEIHGLRGNDYLVIKIGNAGEVNQELISVKLNRTIKWMLGTEVQETKVCVYSKGGDPDWDRYFTTPGGSALLMTQLNTTTANLSLNKRFFVGSQPHRVVKVDDYSEDGVLILTLMEDILTDRDMNGVCDYLSPAASATYLLVGKSEIRVKGTGVYTLVQDGIETPLSPVDWSISPLDTTKIQVNQFADKLEIIALTGSIGYEFTISAISGIANVTKTVKITSLV